MSVPSRWRRYVLDVATRPGPLQAAAEREVQADKAARVRRLAKSLPRRKAAAGAAAGRSGATRAVREAVVTRAAGRCEACGAEVSSRTGALDHFFGRARSELVETCWFLCRTCDHQKTENKPGRLWWLQRFRQHAVKHGLGRALQLVTQQLALELPERVP